VENSKPSKQLKILKFGIRWSKLKVKIVTDTLKTLEAPAGVVIVSNPDLVRVIRGDTEETCPNPILVVVEREEK